MKNKILESGLISMYNYSLMSKEVRKIFSTLNLLKVKYGNVALPTITSNYEVKYNSFVNSNSSKVEDYVIKKLTKQENLEQYVLSIVSAMQKLNREERIVFVEYYANDNVDDNIGMTVGCCRDMVIKIRKSAVIKFLTAMGQDEKYFL
jgi:ArpU family phage transcriptional regulator